MQKWHMEDDTKAAAEAKTDLSKFRVSCFFVSLCVDANTIFLVISLYFLYYIDIPLVNWPGKTKREVFYKLALVEQSCSTIYWEKL